MRNNLLSLVIQDISNFEGTQNIKLSKTIRGLFMAVDKKRVFYFFQLLTKPGGKNLLILLENDLKLVHLPGLKVFRSELIEDLLQVRIF